MLRHGTSGDGMVAKGWLKTPDESKVTDKEISAGAQAGSIARSETTADRVRSALRRRWRRWATYLAGRMGRFDHWKAVDWSRVERLVFVCSGNICRSPYAEHLAIRHGLAAVSCGTTAKGGATADPTATGVAAERGVSLTEHRSRHLDDIRLVAGDLLVVMDLGHLTALEGLVGESNAQLTLLGLWDGAHPVVIHDPFGRSTEHFQVCFGRIDHCLNGLVETRDQAKVCVGSQFVD